MTQANLKNNPSSSILKNTRQTKGLTLEIVHEATKVPMDALRAIEEGYSTRILTPFYYRGFIKIYAEFLGLNVADVLKEYNVQAPENKVIATAKPSVKPATSSTKAKVKAPPSPIMEKNNPLEPVQEIWKKFWTAKNRMFLFRALVVVVALFILVKFTGCIINTIKNIIYTKRWYLFFNLLLLWL